VWPDPQAYADVLVLAIKSALAPVEAAQAALQAQIADLSRRVQDDTVTQELGALRERVAVVEVRPGLPGPPGEPGLPGKDGADGQPGLEWRGIYTDEKTYKRGDLSKWNGSTYVCLKTTTGVKPDAQPAHTTGPEGRMEFRGVHGKDFWELFVSKGDPGKAAR
jgi:hypothetical protein